jgi:hypothetical protein
LQFSQFTTNNAFGQEIEMKMYRHKAIVQYVETICESKNKNEDDLEQLIALVIEWIKKEDPTIDVEISDSLLKEREVPIHSDCGDFGHWKPKNHWASEIAEYAVCDLEAVKTGVDHRMLRTVLVAPCHCGRTEKFRHCNEQGWSFLELRKKDEAAVRLYARTPA